MVSAGYEPGVHASHPENLVPRSILLMSIGLFAALVLVGCGSTTASKTMSRSIALDDGDATDLRIESNNGAIRIEEDPDAEEMLVLGSFTAGGATDAEAARRLADFDLQVERTGTGAWSISPVLPVSSRGEDGVRFVVTVPRIGDASVRTRNGSIAVAASRGDLDLDTRNGSISVGAANGRVIGRTRNGRITCELVNPDFTGEVDLDTRNGRIELRLPAACVGMLAADTRNGTLEHDAFEGMEIRHSSETSVNLAGEGKATIVLLTRNGSVRIKELPIEDAAGAS